VGHIFARIQRGEGILKYNLHLSSQVPHPGFTVSEDALPFQENVTPSRCLNQKDQTTQRGFTATGLTHKPEGFTFPDLQANPVDGLNRCDLTQEYPTRDRKMLDQIPDFEQRTI
jgi:hypothetical protein